MAAPDGRVAEVVGNEQNRRGGRADSGVPPHGTWRPPGSEAGGDAPVAELLEVDREYRLKATAGELHRIAPRRQDPWQKGWLPVLHTYRGPRQYTAMFAITPRAHQLGMTHDWVILYYDGDRREHLATVITSRFGPLRGHRVVRGREAECASYYAQCEPVAQDSSL